MKVLILHSVPLRGSGSGTYVYYLASNLMKKHELVVLYPGPQLKEPFPVRNIPVDPVPVFTSHPTVHSKSIMEYSVSELIEFISLYNNELEKVLIDFSPDVIHIQHFGLWLSVPLLKELSTEIPLIVTAHGTGLYVLESDKRFKKLFRESIDNLNRVIAVSNDVKKRTERLFPNLKNRIDTIMGGVDIYRFKKTGKTGYQWKRKYNLKDKVVLYVGRLIKEKGVQHLINVAPYFPDTSFVITGSGDYRNVLEKMSKVHENILILPHLDNEIVDFFVHSDVLCVPSIWEEALGLVILEAMASKTAVVASNIGGIPSIVRHNETGLLFEPGNEEDLKDRIAHVLNDRKLSKRLTENAYRMIKENFTWKKIAERIDSIYCKSIE